MDIVWTEILGMAATNGLWAVLFCCLLFHQIKDSRKREAKYQDTVDKLAEKLSIVRDMQSGLVEINEDITEMKTILLKAVTAKKPRVKKQSVTVESISALSESVAGDTASGEPAASA